ncbi:hypothetical protein ACFWIF_09400, partial [Corynebacterium bovis]
MSTSDGRHAAAPGTDTGTPGTHAGPHTGPHTGANPGTPGDGHAPGARTPEEHLAAVTEAVRGAVPGLHDAADGGVPVELAVGRTRRRRRGGARRLPSLRQLPDGRLRPRRAPPR